MFLCIFLFLWGNDNWYSIFLFFHHKWLQWAFMLKKVMRDPILSFSITYPHQVIEMAKAGPFPLLLNRIHYGHIKWWNINHQSLIKLCHFAFQGFTDIFNSVSAQIHVIHYHVDAMIQRVYLLFIYLYYS